MTNPQPQKNPLANNPYALSSGIIYLNNKEEMKQQLPDILSRALARSWIDGDFYRQFCYNPRATLESHGIYLPETVSLELQKPNSNRPRVVVHEQKEGSKFKLRILYLQLVMVAGK